MIVERILDAIRQIGKYTCIIAVVIAVANGLIKQQFWAPLYVSVACWIGLILWIVAAGSLWLMKKKTATRAARKAL